jgi:hypothetical protein
MNMNADEPASKPGAAPDAGDPELEVASVVQ